MRCLAAVMLRATFLPAAAVAERPNVVLILIDNQGSGDIAALGNPVVKTPAIDRWTLRPCAARSKAREWLALMNEKTRSGK